MTDIFNFKVGICQRYQARFSDFFLRIKRFKLTYSPVTNGQLLRFLKTRVFSV